MTEPIVIWGVGTTRTMRVHWMVHELELQYETHRIGSRTGETHGDTYSRLNPKHKIPTMQHGDFVLTESFAIMRYLRTLTDTLTHDEYQTSPEGRARYDEWASFILMELDATSLYVVRRHGDLPEIYGDAPEAVASGRQYFSTMLDSIGERIPDDRPLWGSVFSELDILMTIMLDWAAWLDIELPKQLLAYQKLMHQRPAYRTALRHNFGARDT